MINQKSNGKQTQDAQEEMSRVRRLSSTEQEDRYLYGVRNLEMAIRFSL